MMGRARSVPACFARGESGLSTLTVVLLFLILGSIVIAPILLYMGVGLEASQTHERRTDELYAADAGVNYAIWHSEEYGEVPADWEDPETFVMNDKDVVVDIDDIPPPEGEEGPFYLITSTAYSQDTDSSTTVESCVSLTSGIPEFFGNAITSRQTVTIQPDSVVNGNVQLPSEEGLTLRERATINGDIIYEPVNNWPEVGELSEFYWQDVKDSGSFPDSSIDIAGSDIELGPLYRDGDLEIFNTGGPATVTLTGTIYVTGQLKIAKTVYDLTLDLNDQVIYSEYYDEGGVTAIDIGGKCAVTGSAWIVAAGDVFFLPKIESNPDDFIFIISVLGDVKFQPEGTFNGSVAGNTDVRLQPKYPFNCEGNPGGGNFPPVFWAQIMTYNIYHHVPVPE